MRWTGKSEIWICRKKGFRKTNKIDGASIKRKKKYVQKTKRAKIDSRRTKESFKRS